MSRVFSAEELAGVYVRLKEFAAKGGVRVVEVSRTKMHKLPDTQLCPFVGTLAIDWQAKILYVDATVLSAETLGAMVHELGHLVAINEEPMRSSEWLFLGWESVVARKLRMWDVWDFSMAEYSMANGDEYGELSPKEQARELVKARAEGVQAGNLTKSRQPVFVR